MNKIQLTEDNRGNFESALRKYHDENPVGKDVHVAEDDDTLLEMFDAEEFDFENDPSGEDEEIADLPKLFWNTYTEAKTFPETQKEKAFESSCKGQCAKAFRKCWRQEYLSMRFMFRYICECCMYSKDNRPITFRIHEWNDNWKQCRFELLFEEQERRVVLGLGPSGCGKSTVSKPIYPTYGLKTVVAIDGGNARAVSFTWTAFKWINPNGIGNLYKLMTSKYNVKKRIVQLMLTHESGHLFKHAKASACTLYVADTVSGLTNSSSKFIALDDNWIGLLIWQHKNCTNSDCSNDVFKTCPFPSQFRCLGCDKLGSSRALTKEGKKYDSDAMFRSMNIAYAIILKSKHKVMIHNSGKEGVKSIYVTDDKTNDEKDEKKLFKIIRMPFPTSGMGVGATDLRAGFGLIGWGLKACLSEIARHLGGNCRRIWSTTFGRRLMGGNKTIRKP